jgi:serine/threonine protein kinase
MTPAAAKVIDSATIKDDATRSLLDNEKLALQSIDHANVVRLKDIIDQEGKCFIITELCEGETLCELILRRGRLA